MKNALMKQMTTLARWLLQQLRYSVLWLGGYRGVPMMSRPTLRRELISTFFLGGAAGVMAPKFLSLFLLKSLQAEPILLAVLGSEFALGNLFGTVIGSYLQRRKRIPWIVGARTVIAAILLIIAFLPAEKQSAVPFVLLFIVPFMMTAVASNAMSSVWHSNYSADVRGQIFSRRFIIFMGTMACSAMGAATVLDKWPWGHRVVFPAAAVCMFASAWAYRKIRVRSERTMLRRENSGRLEFFEGVSILWRDRKFGRYMAWQMVSGSMVLICREPVVLMMNEHMHVDYKQGASAMVMVPILIALVAAPVFGRLFDSIGITRLRALGAMLTASSRIVLWGALATQSWILVLISFSVIGLSRSPNILAWNLGHTHFAKPQQGQVYMGIHMTLQGLRGLTMPFLGIWLYGLGFIGTWLLIGAAGVQMITVIGFYFCPVPSRDQIDAD